jgi:hypothetical protein
MVYDTATSVLFGWPLVYNELILLFYSTNKNAYGREFVYMLHLIGTDHTKKDAARAISLVRC